MNVQACALLATAALCLSLVSPNAQAGVITYLDLTDDVTIATDIASRIEPIGSFPLCFSGFELCDFVVSAPNNNAVIINSTFTQNVRIEIAEPGGILFSDDILPQTLQIGGSSFIIRFESDIEGDPPFFCADFGGCQITENGLTQLAGTVTWSDGTVDSIQFQSDISDAPEPSSALLVLSGLVLLGRKCLVQQSGRKKQ